MATRGYNSYFPLFVMKLQLKNGIKKEKLACFLRGAVINQERFAMVCIRYILEPFVSLAVKVLRCISVFFKNPAIDNFETQNLSP